MAAVNIHSSSGNYCLNNWKKVVYLHRCRDKTTKRGDKKSPLFILKMFEKKVKDLLNEALTAQPELFLIDLTISPDKKILVTIDGDKGVSLQDCMNISRAIEHNLDREEIDFSLAVAAAGATAPLKMPRQYIHNLGRTLSVKLATEEVEGTLTEAGDTRIELQWKSREPKPIGKGKVTVNKKQEISYKDIVEAKVMITF